MDSSNSSTFSYWTVVPGANVGKVPIPTRFVESTQGSERYRTVCHNDGDLKQGAKDFSLCMKHQQGTCRMGDRCHQLHVNPEFFSATKFWDEVRRTCCAKHEDFNSRSDEFLQKLNSHKFEVMGVPGVNNCCPMDSTMLARTAGLLEMIRSRPTNDTRPIQFSVRQICRLHINDECRFGRDCGRIHVCRDFANKELPLPPVPRKKGKEMSMGSGHINASNSFGSNDGAQGSQGSWMRGGMGGNQMLPQPSLAHLQAASAGGMLGGGRLNAIDMNKFHQQPIISQQQRSGPNAMLSGVNQNINLGNPMMNSGFSSSAFPNSMMTGGRGFAMDPSTPLSTNTPGSLPNIVRSVVDMTLGDQEQAELLRRRQAAALAALGMSPNALQFQNLFPALSGQNQGVNSAMQSNNTALPMQHHFNQNQNTALQPNALRAAVQNENIRPNNNQPVTSSLLHQALRGSFTGKATDATKPTQNPTTAGMSRPLGNLTNATNTAAMGGSAIGKLGSMAENGDYSMFAGTHIFPHSVLPAGVSPFSPLNLNGHNNNAAQQQATTLETRQ